MHEINWNDSYEYGSFGNWSLFLLADQGWHSDKVLKLAIGGGSVAYYKLNSENPVEEATRIFFDLLRLFKKNLHALQQRAEEAEEGGSVELCGDVSFSTQSGFSMNNQFRLYFSLRFSKIDLVLAYCNRGHRSNLVLHTREAPGSMSRMCKDLIRAIRMTERDGRTTWRYLG